MAAKDTCIQLGGNNVKKLSSEIIPDGSPEKKQHLIALRDLQPSAWTKAESVLEQGRMVLFPNTNVYNAKETNTSNIYIASNPIDTLGTTSNVSRSVTFNATSIPNGAYIIGAYVLNPSSSLGVECVIDNAGLDENNCKTGDIYVHCKSFNPELSISGCTCLVAYYYEYSNTWCPDFSESASQVVLTSNDFIMDITMGWAVPAGTYYPKFFIDGWKNDYTNFATQSWAIPQIGEGTSTYDVSTAAIPEESIILCVNFSEGTTTRAMVADIRSGINTKGVVNASTVTVRVFKSSRATTPVCRVLLNYLQAGTSI